MTAKKNPVSAPKLPSSQLGLSSAMHDLQMLRADYAESVSESDLPSLSLGDIQKGPGFILMPNAPQKGLRNSDKWRGISLLLLMLLGLSTSAFAYIWHDSATRLPEMRVLDMSITPEIDFDYQGPEKEEALSPLPKWQTSTEPQSLYRVTESAPPIARQRRTSSPPKAKRELRKARVELSTPKASPDNSCEEVACLVDPSGLCCSPDNESISEIDREEELASRPYKVSRSQAKEAFSPIQSTINRCYDRHDGNGLATLTLRISPDGKVLSASASEGQAEFRTCIESAATGLSFPKLQQPFTLRYLVRQN